jgi:hypothetical protein
MLLWPGVYLCLNQSPLDFSIAFSEFWTGFSTGTVFFSFFKPIYDRNKGSKVIFSC